MALEDPVGDERREVQHLLGDEVRRVQRREVVVEAALELGRTGRARSCPGGSRRGRRPPPGTTTAVRRPRPGGGAAGRSARAGATRRGSRAPRRSGALRRGRRRRRSSGSVATPMRRVRVVRAVLGDPVVERPAQRERRLALGDALDHEPVGGVERGRGRCGRRPCRRVAAPARRRPGPPPASRTAWASARARRPPRRGPRCGSRRGRRRRSGSGRPTAATRGA